MEVEGSNTLSVSASGSAPGTDSTGQRICFGCNQPGHYRKHCPVNPLVRNNDGPGQNQAGGKRGGKRGGRGGKGGNKRKVYEGKRGDDREPKKPRTEGAEGEEAKRETSTRPPNPDSNRDKTPKRKIVLLIGYCGKDYIGLQRNPGCRTIEGELEMQLTKSGIISADNSGTFNKVGWQSCARTDKGVSALGNVISFKAVLIPNFIEKLNENLPADIRAFEYQRVGNSFNAKKKCTGRRYHYILPTSVFAPTKAHPKYDPEAKFVFDDSVRAAVNEVLQVYLGTNEYHNFTSGGGPKRAGDPSAKRVMFSLEISAPFVIDDVEYAEVTIHGQRKMMAMVICLIRDGQSKSIINACFQPPKKNLPVAPALGLFLGKTYFESYNMNCAPHKPLTWEESEEVMNKFKMEVIVPHIANTNKTEKSYETWLAHVDENPFNYDFLRCTTPAEMNEKFPTWIGGGPPEMCTYGKDKKEEEEDEAGEAENGEENSG